MNTFNRHRLGLLLLATSIVIMVGACGKELGPDKDVPGAVSDLVADSVIQGTAYMSWTATGDDGTTGRASSYDLRYATDSLTLVNAWATATAAAPLPVPKTSGANETCELEGLTERVTYWVALKVSDEAGNVSNLSNIVRLTWSDSLGLTFPELHTADCDAVVVPLTVHSFAAVSGVQLYVAYQPENVTFDSVVSAVLDDVTSNDVSGTISLIWADMSLMSPLTLDDGDTLAMFYFSDLTGTNSLSIQSQTKVVDTAAVYFTIDKTHGSMTCTGGSGDKMLYIGNMDSVSLTTPGGIYSHYQEIKVWQDAGYSVAVKSIGSVDITDSLLAQYDVFNLYGWTHPVSADEAAAIESWVYSGGSLLAVVTASPGVPAVSSFGVERIDGNHGGTSGLDWYFHGSPLLIGPVSGPVNGVGNLGAESMDRAVLKAGHSLTIDATKSGYPAVVHGDFGLGSVVIVFAGGWNHDATKSNNAYRSTIFQYDNAAFLQDVVEYLSH